MNQTAAAPAFDETLSDQLVFSRRLQSLANKIHATAAIDEIMLDLSQDICALFGCDRLTIYAVDDSRTGIRSRVKTGMGSFRDFSLPIAESSIAGYVALHKRMVNVRDVYDTAELASHVPPLQFVRQVDERTGYRTCEILCAPLVNAGSNELLGVVQLINNRDRRPFPAPLEEGVAQLCATLAVAFAQRMKPPVVIRDKYDPLVAHGILDMAELGLATRSARRKGLDIEDVLVDEFQVRRADIGAALARFYGVPYAPALAGRVRPADALAYFSRADLERLGWVPLELQGQLLTVMCLDPEEARLSGRAAGYFPHWDLGYCVSTAAEFRQTLEQFYPSAGTPASAARGRWDYDAMHHLQSAEMALALRVQQAISAAFGQASLADIRIELRPLEGKTVSRFRKDGELESISGSLAVDYQLEFDGEGRRRESESPLSGLNKICPEESE